MRIAIVSSPRSGNTWLRRLLSDGLNLQEVAVHNYLEADSIPEHCILQIHWYREPNFQSFLSDYEFRVVTLARHPLDVLLSVLHFVRWEPETVRWLGGNCEIPPALAGCSSASGAFLEYATSFGSENLLSVTYQWWHEVTALKVRYEELASDPTNQATQLMKPLGISSDDVSKALAANSLDRFKAMPNRHGWQGRPGVWRELIPATTAAAIYARHQLVFEKLGYRIDDTGLTHAEAERNWKRSLR